MSPKPTSGELNILQVLWERGPSTVRQVHDCLEEKSASGYTTTLKLMQIMHDKGMVARVQDGRTHIYRAVAKQEEMQVRLLDRASRT